MKEVFIPQRFAKKSEHILGLVNGFMESYAAQGLSLTVRQLYYRLVASGAIPNNYKSYKVIKSLISDARLAGRIDWDMIVDRGRNATRPRNWENASDAVRWVLGQFRIDKWIDQKYHVECMVEKQALEGVLEPVCDELDITFTANKGYSSQSTLYEAGRRIDNQIQDGKKILICYLGDHDPSGIDMTRDVLRRLSLFARSSDVEVERLALNMDQVEEYNPPENPAKETDSRCAGYIEQFGESSWELDALEPSVMGTLLREAVVKVRDEKKWKVKLKEEEKLKAVLEDAADELADPKHTAEMLETMEKGFLAEQSMRLTDNAEYEAVIARLTEKLKRKKSKPKTKKVKKTK